MAGVAQAFLESLPGVGPWLALAMRTSVGRSLIEAQRILADALSRHGIKVLDDLTEEQREWFIPAGYRFFEQARLGEYEHNLRVLAALIANELQSQQRDCGRILRTARRLEGIRAADLEVIARTPVAIAQHQSRRGEKARSRTFSIQDLSIAMLSTRSNDELNSSAIELVWRGILVQDVSYIRGPTVGDDLFLTTSAFDEIIDAAREIVPVGA
jgi:hypothetical protein